MARGGGLATAGQADFSAGMWRSVARQLIDGRGAWTLRDFLLDDDGAAYVRGGTVYKSPSTLSGGRLVFVWAGILSSGLRTIVATATRFGVLDADDATLLGINAGFGGLTGPARAVLVGDLLFIEGGYVYGGSRKVASYAAGGTVSVTNGSANVVGAGTAFLANVDAGMLFRRSGAERFYVVQAVNNDTSLTLTEPYDGATGAGVAGFELRPIGSVASPYKSGIFATAGDRLLVASGNDLFFSEGRDPVDGYLRPHSFPALNRHEFLEGGAVLGAQGLRGSALVFTAGGLYAVQNLAFNLVDAAGGMQQAVHLVTRELVLWGGNAGVTTWQNALVVPTLDGVYLVDGVSTPVPVSRSIERLYREYVAAGYRPGGAAVYRNHLFLPIVQGAATVVDVLVCRLDRPVGRTRLGDVWPWTQFSGHAGGAAQLATRVSATGAPALLAAGDDAEGRLLDVTGVFAPADRIVDADGADVPWLFEQRDVATGGGNLNHVRTLEVLYELAHAERDILPLPSSTAGAWSVTNGVMTPATPAGVTVNPSNGAVTPMVALYPAAVAGEETVTRDDVVEAKVTLRVAALGALMSAVRVYARFSDSGGVNIATTLLVTGGPYELGDVMVLEGSTVAPENAAYVQLRLHLTPWPGSSFGAVEFELRNEESYLRVKSDPGVRAWYATGGEGEDVGAKWGELEWGVDAWADGSLDEYTQLEGRGVTSRGRDPHRWRLRRPARTRYIRGRLQPSGRTAKLKLRALAWKIRPARRDR